MVQQRTEEEKLVQAPLMVTLGGKEYEIKPLVIRDSRIWRQQVVKVLASLPLDLKASSDKPEELNSVLSMYLSNKPDDLVDLFFSYAKDLDRDAIEQVASDAEIAAAFDGVIKIAFPLSGSLVRTMQNLVR